MPMARAVKRPMRLRRPSEGARVSSTRRASWGLSASGTRRSTRAMKAMPPKKAPAVAQAAGPAAITWASWARALTRISTKET